MMIASNSEVWSSSRFGFYARKVFTVRANVLILHSTAPTLDETLDSKHGSLYCNYTAFLFCFVRPLRSISIPTKHNKTAKQSKKVAAKARLISQIATRPTNTRAEIPENEASASNQKWSYKNEPEV